MESHPTQAVLPLVGLAADQVIRDRYNHSHPSPTGIVTSGSVSQIRQPLSTRAGN
ncbi:MAG: hypothetical protein ACQESR_21900 [Planctomycetota bacterium]